MKPVQLAQQPGRRVVIKRPLIILVFLCLDAVLFSSSVPVGVNSPPFYEVWPLLVRRVDPHFYRVALHKEDKSWVPETQVLHIC